MIKIPARVKIFDAIMIAIFAVLLTAARFLGDYNLFQDQRGIDKKRDSGSAGALFPR